MIDNLNGSDLEHSEIREENREEKTADSKHFLAESFEGLADNIYESIMVVARRARQIGDAQKKEIDRQIGTMDLAEQLEEEQPDEDAPEPEFYRYEKPTVLAMVEMVDGKLEFKYKK